MHIHNRYFGVRQPKSVDAVGLFQCLDKALTFLGITCEEHSKLIGFGCDGANVNMGNHGVGY